MIDRSEVGFPISPDKSWRRCFHLFIRGIVVYILIVGFPKPSFAFDVSVKSFKNNSNELKVSVNQAAYQMDPTNASPIWFVVAFSKPVSGFTPDDVRLSGDAGPVTAVVTGQGTGYEIAVSGMVGDGEVVVFIPAGVVTDENGNVNTASTGIDHSVMYDTTPPGVPIVEAPAYANDFPPTWKWTSGGGGNGTFRYKLDDDEMTSGAVLTKSVGFTPVMILKSGEHTLYVQERDDAGNWSDTGSFTTIVNKKPDFVGIPNVTIFEDTFETVIDLWPFFSDDLDSSEELKYTHSEKFIDNPGLFLSVSIDIDNRYLRLRYTPDAHGNALVTVTAMDSYGAFTTVTFMVQVIAVNDAPKVNPKVVLSLPPIEEDIPDELNTGISVSDLLSSDRFFPDPISDADINSIKGIAVVGLNTSHGHWEYDVLESGKFSKFPEISETNALLLNIEAMVRFVPMKDYSGIVHPGITFRAWDHTAGAKGEMADASQNGGTTAFSAETISAKIRIKPVNDKPQASDDTYAAIWNTGLIIPVPGVLGNDMDIDGDELTVKVETPASHGDLALYPNGSFSYTPDSDFLGTDAFTYTVSDGMETSFPAEVRIEVRQTSPFDECPGDPNKITPGICGCGFPDIDSDNDGTFDCMDECPNDPDKVEPGKCGCGKPETENCIVNHPPETPYGIYPEDGGFVPENTVILKAAPFSDPDGDALARIYWRIREIFNECSPVVDVIIDSDTVEEPSEYSAENLEYGMRYIWQIGYEDVDGGHIVWSEENEFTVGSQILNDAVVIDPGVDAADFCLASFPFWLNDRIFREEIETVMGGVFDGNNYRIVAYDAEVGGFIDFEENDFDVVPGKAYGILARYGMELYLEGSSVTLNTDIVVPLPYNSSAGLGWHLIASPNASAYDWENITVIVEDRQCEIQLGPTKIHALSFPNNSIDNRLWRLENGEYSPDTRIMKPFTGYWIRVKREGVKLVFSPDARISSDPSGISPIRNAVDESDDRPPPMPEGLDHPPPDTESGSGGCFIDMITPKKTKKVCGKLMD